MNPSAQRLEVPAATHLLYRHHADRGDRAAVVESIGPCYFCGYEGPGRPAGEVISDQYFSDHPLRRQPASDHVCAACAYCMETRTLKQGHWIAHGDGVRLPSTGDLLDVFSELRDGAYPVPLAVHVTSSPIRSSHAYLWTPVNETMPPLTIAYDRQHVRIDDWQAFEALLVAVEDLRLHGFTFDELRSGEPRVRNLREIGRESYQECDDVIDPHRRTARLELALTLSRGADDQPRSDRTDPHDPLS